MGKKKNEQPVAVGSSEAQADAAAADIQSGQAEPAQPGAAVVGPETKSQAKEVAAKGPIVVKYRDHIGVATERTFSEDVHGPDFAKLAEEFKATNASKIID